MAISKCKHCLKPFERIGPNTLCFDCTNQEKQSYKNAYKLIEDADEEGLNYDLVAQMTNFPKQKLVDGIQVRLNKKHSGELPEYKKGYCYITGEWLNHPDGREPLSLGVIEAVAHAIERIQNSPASMGLPNPLGAGKAAPPAGQPSKPAGGMGNPALLSLEGGGMPLPSLQGRPGVLREDPHSGELVVSVSTYDAILKELDAYKKKFGPLALSGTPGAVQPAGSPTASAALTGLPAITFDKPASASLSGSGADFLDILDEDESAVKQNFQPSTPAGGALPSSAGVDGGGGAPQRQFGFKRVP